MADEKALAEQNRQDTNQNQNPPPAQPRPVINAFSRLPSAGPIILAFNTAAGAAALTVGLIFYYLFFIYTPDGTADTDSFLTVMFSYRVAAMMPLPVAVVVWGAAALTVGLGFYWFFIYTPDGTAGTDSFLSVMFSYRVAAMMPLPVALLVWAAAAGLIFLAFSSTAVAIYRARDYPWPVAFVVLFFLDLLLLFHFLRLLVAAPPNSNSNSPRRRCLTTAVWILASFLTVMLSYGVADMMLAVVSCAAALAVGLAFYWFSIYTPDGTADTDSFLTVMFSYRVAAMMPLPVAVFVWGAAAALIFLAFSTAVAVYRARDYPWPAAFVVLFYLDLLLLFYFLRLLVAEPPNSNSPRRGCLRTAVLFLACFLTVMLSYGVGDMMLAVVWCAAALAVGLGFYWFSHYTPDGYFYPTDLKDDDICDML